MKTSLFLKHTRPATKHTHPHNDSCMWSARGAAHLRDDEGSWSQSW